MKKSQKQLDFEYRLLIIRESSKGIHEFLSYNSSDESKKWLDQLESLLVLLAEYTDNTYNLIDSE